jgi:hypothetical protein
LRVDTIVVSSVGTFEMGTAAQPVAANVRARLLFTDNGPIDRVWDPFAISRGLISHGSVSMYGAAVTSYAATAVPILAGTQTLTLKSTPTGWKSGDRIVIAGTTAGASQNEVRQVVLVSGNTVLLDQPLSFNHSAPAGSTFDVHIANTTRNVVLESEGTAADRRGHVMFMHDRDVHIGYTGFYTLGRTDKLVPINDSVVLADWSLKPGTGTNQRARYAVHFHRNGLTNDGNPSTVVGSVVVDSPGWGFVNHSSYVDMTENVAYAVSGAAFSTEVGDEIGGFYRNIALGTTGANEEINAREGIQDFGFQGDGFWFQGAGVSVVGNISAGNQGQAFVFYNRGLIEGGVQGRFLSANLSNPAIANGATSIPVGQVPMSNFRNNQGYSSLVGLTVRYHLENAIHSQYSVFADSQFWNNTVGMELPYVQNTILRNLSFVQTQANTVDALQSNLVTGNIVYENLTVKGYRRGIIAPRWGNNVIDGGTFANEYDIVIPTAALTARWLDIRNVSGTPRIITEPMLNPPLHDNNSAELFFVSDIVTLNFGQFVNRRLYSILQLANFVPFPTPRADVNPIYVGKTNQELWNTYGYAIGGAIAPAITFTVPYIELAVIA